MKSVLCAGFNKVSFSYYETVRLSYMSERRTWYWTDTVGFIKKFLLIHISINFIFTDIKLYTTVALRQSKAGSTESGFLHLS